jgi:succinate dehydrogenase/fumarate reductase cytochrome b subunit
MPRFLIARLFIILIFLLVFYHAIAALRTGEIRSRGYKFNRDESPIGYWFTVLITLVGPVLIIYLMLTR